MQVRMRRCRTRKLELGETQCDLEVGAYDEVRAGLERKR